MKTKKATKSVSKKEVKNIAAEVLKHVRDEPENVGAWTCPRCDQWYENEDDARDCCPNEAEEAEGWKCPECDEVYEEKQGAEDCCLKVSDE
jgi:uncharacterized C2H2 Zn-finger protein